MVYSFLLLIYLFGCITTVKTSQNSFQSKRSVDYFLFSYKNAPNIPNTNHQMFFNWDNLVFISILILFFLLLLICCCYQRSLFNCIFTRSDKKKHNLTNINERATILHQTPVMDNSKSIYLTVPQPSYLHH
jgi:hypothetical protein